MSDATVNQFLSHKDPLERAFIYGEELISNAEIKECLNILDTTYAYIKGDTTFDKLDRPSAWEKSKPSIEKSLILDLKPLPSHLCYEYLANNNTLHEIMRVEFQPPIGMMYFDVDSHLGQPRAWGQGRPSQDTCSSYGVARKDLKQLSNDAVESECIDFLFAICMDVGGTKIDGEITLTIEEVRLNERQRVDATVTGFLVVFRSLVEKISVCGCGASPAERSVRWCGGLFWWFASGERRGDEGDGGERELVRCSPMVAGAETRESENREIRRMSLAGDKATGGATAGVLGKGKCV
ncbi:hypothetical protein HAX54_033476 [Datura stramonium]|uniref:Uncharacterized protein n=1 Tax=Datura stramonium TaxID=4076 RepID=A0ABS8SDI4_DATST|nr:hypothetical protein [Datura stramonium]